MTISAELEAKILRLYHVEKWWIGTISRQLGVHCVFRPKSISHSSSTRSLIPILIRSFIPFLRDH